MDIAGNRAVLDPVKAAILTGPAAPAAIKTLPSQGLIAIDTINNIGYVPIYTEDASGNGQVAVVDLTSRRANPILKLVSLPGTSTAIASNFFADTGRVYVLAANGPIWLFTSSGLRTTRSRPRLPATGLNFFGSFGGVIVDGPRQHVVVARQQRDWPARHLHQPADLESSLDRQRSRHRFVLAELDDRL